MEGWGILTCNCVRWFSVLRQRWWWQQRLWVVSVGRDILDPVEGGVAIKLKNIKKLAMGNGSQKLEGGNSYLCSRSLLLCTATKEALVAAALGCVCGPRYVGSRGGGGVAN